MQMDIFHVPPYWPHCLSGHKGSPMGIQRQKWSMNQGQDKKSFTGLPLNPLWCLFILTCQEKRHDTFDTEQALLSTAYAVAGLQYLLWSSWQRNCDSLWSHQYIFCAKSGNISPPTWGVMLFMHHLYFHVIFFLLQFHWGGRRERNRYFILFI